MLQGCLEEEWFMKKLALLLSGFFTSSLVATSVVADPTASGPQPGTVEAMQCLNHQGPKGCETIFVGQARLMAQPWVFQNPSRDASRGSFVSSNYEGRATGSNYMDAKVMSTLPTREMDIFHVKFSRAEYTFYVSAPDADGKIHALATPVFH
jgi:hypothetical protein